MLMIKNIYGSELPDGTVWCPPKVVVTRQKRKKINYPDAIYYRATSLGFMDGIGFSFVGAIANFVRVNHLILFEKEVRGIKPDTEILGRAPEGWKPQERTSAEIFFTNACVKNPKKGKQI